MKDGSINGAETLVEPEESASGKDRFAGMRFIGRPHEIKIGSSSHTKPCFQRAPLRSPRQVGIEEKTAEHPEISFFIRAALREAGLELAGYRIAPMVRRIPACLRALRVPTVTAAIKALQEDPSKLRTAVNTLLIGSTSFLRDTQVFARLEDHLLPEILQRNSAPRIWSAGCSDGSELYSVAMLVSEIQPDHQAHFLGSDCRPTILETAKAGLYSADAIQGIRPDLRRRYLAQMGNRHGFRADITSRMKWEQHDLCSAPAEGQWDLILCRNVAIYLKAESARIMWNRLAAALSPEGILVTGRAENPGVESLLRIGPCLFRKPISATDIP